jgi:phosphonate transport system substrate-binding protein
MKIITFIALILQLTFITCFAEVKFGTLSILDSEVLTKKMTPITDYISQALEEDIKLYIGRNYEDTMKKIANGSLDMGFIGPAPYVKIKDQVELVATLRSGVAPCFKSVIITSKSSDIHELSDLKGKSFAFGSPHSTLAFYVPAAILNNNGIIKTLKDYRFLNKHDRVAKNVIMGKYDAGAIKISVYETYKEYLRPIRYSKSYYDFAIVVRKGFDQTKKQKLKDAILELKDQKILDSLKKGSKGFVSIDESEYEPILDIIKTVDKLNLVK